MTRLLWLDFLETLVLLASRVQPILHPNSRASIANLVPGFYADEVRRSIIEHQLFMDTLECKSDSTGTWGAEFMARRLLHTQLPVAEKWDMVRHIAARLARDDENSASTYPIYVQELCMRLSESSTHNLFIACQLTASPTPSRSICGGRYCTYDLVSAAACLNKLNVIEEVANDEHSLRQLHGIFDNPYINAALRDNFAALDLLFDRLETHGVVAKPRDVRRQNFPRVAKTCSTAMMRIFMPDDWKDPDFFANIEEDMSETVIGSHMQWLKRGLETTNLETFNVLFRMKEQCSDPYIWEEDLARILRMGCEAGAEEMVRRILALDAPLVGHPHGQCDIIDPLEAACKGKDGYGTPNSARIARILLSYGAEIKGHEVAIAAKTQNMDLVRTLIQAGADVNKGDPKPLVSAIASERPDMFRELIRLGARLDNEVLKECVEKARGEGLESMLELLKQYTFYANSETGLKTTGEGPEEKQWNTWGWWRNANEWKIWAGVNGGSKAVPSTSPDA
jgi:hypothetical protein